LVTHQSLSFSNGQSEITVVKSQPQVMENVECDGPVIINRISDYDLPRLDQNSLKLMYNAFEHQKTPTHVIATYGIHPETAQKEFERYSKLELRDPYVLQKNLTTGISNAPPQIQAIVDKSSTTLLTNVEIMTILEYIMKNYSDTTIQNIVLDPASNLPIGLERATCRICLNQLAGVIYDKNTTVGLHVEQVLGELLCENCKSSREELALHKDLVP
jgi:hypothetical protein